jgi:hypothetical protein
MVKKLSIFNHLFIDYQDELNGVCANLLGLLMLHKH